MKRTSDYQWVWRFIAFAFVFGLALTLQFLDSMHVVFPSVFRLEESMFDRVLQESYLLIGLLVGAILIDLCIGRFSRTSR